MLRKMLSLLKQTKQPTDWDEAADAAGCVPPFLTIASSERRISAKDMQRRLIFGATSSPSDDAGAQLDCSSNVSACRGRTVS